MPPEGRTCPLRPQPTSGLFAGGSGAGITISPIAFLTIREGKVRVLQIEPYLSSVDRALEKVPEVVDKVSSLFSKGSEKEDAPLPGEPAEKASESLNTRSSVDARPHTCLRGGVICVV